MIKFFLVVFIYHIFIYVSTINNYRFHVNINCSSWYDQNYKNILVKLNGKKNLAYKHYINYKYGDLKFAFQNVDLIEKYYYATMKSIFNDPELNRQWYFIRNDYGNTHLSHELDKVWVQGITGKGVIVAIVGGGLEYLHKDLQNNFDSLGSYNILQNSMRIFPTNNNTSTFAAGLISSVPNNFQCGVGAAPYSQIANIQIFDSDKEIFNDDLIGKAIMHRNNQIDIYLFAWNFNYNVKLNKIPGKLSTSSVKMGGKYGRFGLGSIYIMGTGNSRIQGNNCAFDGFIQMKEILVFGAISYKGSPLLTIERCGAIIASSISTEYNISNEKLFSTSFGNTCSDSADGSISAASISAGIIALLISINPSLTVRQIIFLIVLSSIQYDINAIGNSGGFFYSYAFGFGMLYTQGLIELSLLEDINHIAEEHICLTPLMTVFRKISKLNKETIYIYTSGCLESNICVTEVEHAFITITLLANFRNTIKVSLQSPSGTIISVIEPRHFDAVHSSFYNWKVKLMGFFGENPLGVWALHIRTLKYSARLVKFELEFHGTCLNSHLNSVSHHNIIKYICSSIQYRHYNNFQRICNGFRYRNSLKDTLDYLSFTNLELPIDSSLNYYR